MRLGVLRQLHHRLGQLTPQNTTILAKHLTYFAEPSVVFQTTPFYAAEPTAGGDKQTIGCFLRSRHGADLIRGGQK